MSDNSNRAVVIIRESDGKFYRGATFWQWTRNWRWAAILPLRFAEFVVEQRNLSGVKFDFVDDIVARREAKLT